MLSRIVNSFSKYDEWKYWNSLSDPNARKGWEEDTLRDDVNYIREHLQGCEEILELGPGVGRTLPAHSRQSHITCYDITGNYRTRLLERAKELSLSVDHVVAQSLDEPLPYEDASFDAAVASAVLLHQRRERIQAVMAELIRVSRKAIAITSYGTPNRRTDNRSAHAFHHDYPDLCARIGCEMNHVRVIRGRLYFVYRRL
jgi:SAM-dependent methyltransferase